MAFEVVTTSFRMKERRRPLPMTILTYGTLAGGIACYAGLVGVLLLFHQRWIVSDFVSLGQMTYGGMAFSAGYLFARRAGESPGPLAVAGGAAVGAVAAGVVAALPIIGSMVNLRAVFVNASPVLYRFLSFEQGPWAGALVLVIGGMTIAALGAMLWTAPQRIRTPIITGLLATFLVGLLHELIQLFLQADGLPSVIRRLLFRWDGLSPLGAAIIFLCAGFARLTWSLSWFKLSIWYRNLAPALQRGIQATAVTLCVVLLLLLPVTAGSFIGQVMLLVILFILMGLGLNLEVGLAGLLDLGFVAFFAIGAYTVALLTSSSELAIANLPFWAALPAAAFISLMAGVVFGVPVLRIRGDYLAVATLGLGEVVRLLVLSDTLKPFLGGAQGVLGVPKPSIAGVTLADPSHLVYVAITAAAIVAYCAWRLENSSIGRAWMALREDEDVAQALGIRLVNIKLLAYGLGATFAGVGGAIFAALVGSVFPHSFQLIISVNVLALIILGGLGSIPGVIVGALALVGLPELLREFGEFRFLFYGIVLVVMMRFRPEGLWPSSIRLRASQRR